MRDPDKMSRKELVAEYRHLAREQDEYEAKLTEAQERITSLEDKIRRQREALRVLNEAQARITSQLDLEAARRAAEMVQTLKHEPGKAAVELAVARERIAELEALLNDHGPNGRNVTNAQHAALRERIAKLEAVAGAAWAVADDPLGKGEVQMRRMTGAFPAGCKTSRKAVAGMRECKPPRRRVQVTLELGADSWDEVARSLSQMAFEISTGQHRGAVASGGVHSGYRFWATEDKRVTHESYVEALQEYLDEEGGGE